MKTLIPAIPFVALLAGCPIGPSGNEGEGEGEQPLEAVIEMAFPQPMASVLVNDETDPCEDELAHSYAVTEADEYSVKPNPMDPNSRCVAKTLEIESSGTYDLDFTGPGGCGKFPNGTYESEAGSIVEIWTTDDGDQVQIHGDAILPDEVFDLVVTGSEYYGEYDAASGVHVVSSGTISDDLCVITYHEERDGAIYSENIIFRSTDPSCP